MTLTATCWITCSYLDTAVIHVCPDGVVIVQVQQETLVIWGERDTIVPKTFAEVSNSKPLEVAYHAGSNLLFQYVEVLEKI